MRDALLIWQLFIRSSRIERKRAVLTIAAIGWGTVSLLLLLSFGEGLKRQIARGMSGMGVNIAVVFPGETTKNWQGMAPGRPIRTRLEDVALLRQRVAGVDEVVGEMRRWGVSLAYGRKQVNTRVNGESPAFGDLRNHIARPGGRFINDRDEQERRRVVFLGDEVAKDVFGDEEPVGPACLHDDVTTNAVADERAAPPAGDAYYYLVRAQNVCVTGTYGVNSLGSELPLAAGCR